MRAYCVTTISGLFLLVSAVSFACNCTGAPTEERHVLTLQESSDLVVLARVEEVLHREWFDGTEEKSEYVARVTVLEGFKGAEYGLEIHVSTNIGSSCSASLDLQDIYLIFANGPKSDGYYYTTMCTSYKYKTHHNATDEYHDLLRTLVSPTLKILRQN